MQGLGRLPAPAKPRDFAIESGFAQPPRDAKSAQND
jgi:hypothetical protein